MRHTYNKFKQFLIAGALTIIFMGGAASVKAMGNASNICQTPRGICGVQYAPVGSQCGCFTPAGVDPGYIVMPPPNWSDACGTNFGVCQVNYAPIGSGCSCGRVFGQVIPMR